MSSVSFKRDCRTREDVQDAARKLMELEDRHLPITIHIKRIVKRRGEDRNRMLNAHLRDIARHRYGAMTVPERVMDTVVADFKHSDIWPKYSDPEPDYFSGEVLYRPKSRADLTNQEVSGIVSWLAAYMLERDIPSHGPTE